MNKPTLPVQFVFSVLALFETVLKGQGVGYNLELFQNKSVLYFRIHGYKLVNFISI